jgi:superfamily II DNA or RNA helicase
MVAMLQPPSQLPSWVPERVRAYEQAFPLRDYQDEAVTAVAEAVHRDGRRRVMVVLPTGSGKTLVFGALAWGWLADGDGRVLVLAHRDELIQQAVEKLAYMLPRHLIGVVKAEQNQVDAPVVVASIQTLARPNRLAPIGRFGLVVYDEAHHSASRTARDILGALGVFEPDGPVLVGVTATPKRSDGVRLDDIFEGDPVYSRTITEMQALGWLVPIIGRSYQLLGSGVPIKGRRGADGDFAAGWCETVMLGANAPRKMVEAWQTDAAGRKTVVFTPTVSVAQATSDAFLDAGIQAAWVAGEQPKADRRTALADLKSGRALVVANCGVLTEGWDEPSIECVMLGRPTNSQSLYLQMIGRGLRPFRAKENCIVLDMVGIAGQMDLDAALDLKGAPLGASSATTSTEPGDGRDGVPFETADGLLVGTDIALGAGKKGRWIDAGDGWWAFRLLPDRGRARSGGWLTVEPCEDGSYVVRRRGDDMSRTLIRGDLTEDYAFGIAEGVARREGKLFQVGSRARWLDRPITPATLAWTAGKFGATPDWTQWKLMQAQAEMAAARWKRERR